MLEEEYKELLEKYSNCIRFSDGLLEISSVLALDSHEDFAIIVGRAIKKGFKVVAIQEHMTFDKSDHYALFPSMFIAVTALFAMKQANEENPNSYSYFDKNKIQTFK